MRSIAIIPARGGSKGIPLKNLVPVCGRPLLAWSIRQALASKSIDKVLVTTDAGEIAVVAEEEGADIFWRSAETATDEATTEDALLEVFEYWPYGNMPSVAVLLQATSPIRQVHDIDLAVKALRESDADSVFSGCRVDGYLWQSGETLRRMHLERKPRQQHASYTIEENGSIYVFRLDGFLEHRERSFGHIVCYEMHPLDSYQIDEYADIALIESLMTLRMPHAAHHAASH